MNKIAQTARSMLLDKERQRRIQGIKDSIIKYNPKADLIDIEAAFQWAAVNFIPPKTDVIAEFADPLLGVENLVTAHQVEHNKILAAILLPATSSLSKSDLLPIALAEIQRMFGKPVRFLADPNNIATKATRQNDPSDRADEIKKYLKEEYPKFDRSKLEKALAWHKRHYKSAKIKTVDDQFSDPLRIAELLVEYIKADPETIIASILYPAARLMEGMGRDDQRIADIEKNFGAEIATLVDETLLFRSFNLPPIFSETERKDHIVKTIWATVNPRPWAIRATQSLANLLSVTKDKNALAPEITDRILVNVEYIHRPLCELAKFRELEKALDEACFQIKDPIGYKQTRRAISSQLGEDDMAAVRMLIQAHISENFSSESFSWVWENPENAKKLKEDGIQPHVISEDRVKSAASAYRKAQDQGVRVIDLGDLFGIRIIPTRLAVGQDDSHGEVDENTHMKLAQLCERIYGTLSKEFGRYNRRSIDKRINEKTGEEEWYSYRQEFFDRLAQSDPRDEDKGRKKDPERYEKEKILYPHIKDAHFDNYYALKKKSGYRGIHDTMLFRIPGKDGQGKWVALEIQIFDIYQYLMNQFGQETGRFNYKHDLGDYAPAIQDWFQAREEIAAGRPYKGSRHVLVRNEQTGENIDIGENPTVGGFIAAAKLNCTQVRIFHPYYFPQSDKTYGSQTPVPIGSHLIPVWDGPSG